MRVLNLYSGIGGNRKLWENVEVTAVELEQDIAQCYSDLFPSDQVIVGDAHEYLLKNYRNFDFIWASPPCPSHSKIRMMASKRGDYEPLYPDMKLYEEVLFLQSYFDGKYVVENVVPFYEPLISPKRVVGRHCFWANFNIGNFDSEPLNIKENNVEDLESMHGFDLRPYKLGNKLKALRNCVHPKVGQYIMDCAQNIIRKENVTQLSFL